MKIIVRVQLVTDWGEVSEVDVTEVQRPASEFESKTLGPSLGDGKQIMQRLQQTVASAQTEEFCELQRVCPCCHRWNPIKEILLMCRIVEPFHSVGCGRILD